MRLFFLVSRLGFVPLPTLLAVPLKFLLSHLALGSLLHVASLADLVHAFHDLAPRDRGVISFDICARVCWFARRLLGSLDQVL